MVKNTLVIIIFLIVTYVSGQDFTGPSLVDFEFIDHSANVENGPDTIGFSISAMDDITGIGSCSVLLKSPLGNHNAAGMAIFLTSPLSGTAGGEIVIDEYVESGTWKVDQITLYDSYGNKTNYHQFFLQGSYDIEVEVISNQDITAPLITGFILDPGPYETMTSPDMINFIVSATDAVSGLANAFVTFESPLGFHTAGGIINFESGAAGGTESGTAEVGVFVEGGLWRVNEITLRDVVGNDFTYDYLLLQMMGFPTLTCEVLSTSDILAPMMVSCEMETETVNIGSGQGLFTVTISGTDNLSGLKSADIRLESPLGYHTAATFLQFEEGIPAGTATGTGMIKEHSYPGEWTVTEIGIADVAGNRRSYDEFLLQMMGLKITLNVDNVVSVKDETGEILSYQLKQNYPNPFNPNTVIEFTIPERTPARIVIYNTAGEKLLTIGEGEYDPGNYKVGFDASGFSSGVYYYRLITENFGETKKCVLLK